MAKKVDPAATQPAAEPDSAAAELAELSPDIRLTLAGRDVTVREYGFFEGLDVAHRAAAFIADMHDQCRDGELRYDRIRRLFGKHAGVVVVIAAEAAGVEPEWVRGLGKDDAETFMSTWFAVNAGFFVHEVVVEMREERQREQLLAAAKAPAGTSSSPSSPQQASGPSTTSDDSPSAS